MESWCIVMIIVITTEARAQDLETLTDTNGLPPQVLKGMDMSHEAYRFDTFDCDEPEDVLTQSIPQGCSVKAWMEKTRASTQHLNRSI